ncbi:MAG: MFS transporter [Acidimicrobiales bacterium]
MTTPTLVPTGRSWLRAAAVMFGVGWGANQFASLLVAYHQYRGVSVGTDEALFGVYALGLVPALLLGGPASDRWGRARVVQPAALVSVAATLVLLFGSHAVPLLFVGRFLAGAVSGAVFAAGTAWVKELSVAPYDTSAGEQAGARRAAIALSMGFGLGPLVAGAVAQWCPAPLVVSYLPHLVIMALVVPGLWRIPETVPPGAGTGPGLVDRLRVPKALHPRFLAVVVPVAPWVFASASVSFAVLPTVVSSHTRGLGIAFGGLVAGVTLGVGVLVQPLARRIDRSDDARGAAVGMGAVVGGMLLAALAAHLVSPPVVVLAGAVLGAGYGFSLVAGLLEVQRLAGPDDLAGLTAVYYALTYVGFAVPVVLADLVHLTSYAVLLVALAGLASACLAVVARQARAHPDRRQNPT